MKAPACSVVLCYVVLLHAPGRCKHCNVPASGSCPTALGASEAFALAKQAVGNKTVAARRGKGASNQMMPTPYLGLQLHSWLGLVASTRYSLCAVSVNTSCGQDNSVWLARAFYRSSGN